MSLKIGRLETRTVRILRGSVPGVAGTLRRLPQSAKAALSYGYDYILLALFNFYGLLKTTPHRLLAAYTEYLLWLRSPDPVFWLGYKLNKEILGFVFVGVFISAAILLLYLYLMKTYKGKLKTCCERLVHFHRNREEWEVVTNNEKAIDKFGETAEELNRLMALDRASRQQVTEEERETRKSEWERLRRRVRKLLERKAGQIYDSDDSDLGTEVEEEKSPRRIKEANHESQNTSILGVK